MGADLARSEAQPASTELAFQDLEAKARANAEAILSIVGPTASGKTALAIRLCDAVDGEIISVDSVQVYRGFNIGSGKPTREEQARSPHHLIDVLDPLEPMDASKFAAMADDAIREVRGRGKRPVVCGGTFLWVKALLHGLAEAPRGQAELRARHRAVADSQGNESLHRELAQVDPESAARLHPNDFVRVSRALEVFELTGRPLSSHHEDHAFRPIRYPYHMVAIARDTEELTKRIERRAAEWLQSGWIDETRDLLAAGYGGARAMASVGYREVHGFLRGEIAEVDLLPTIVRATRVFARRQRTWIRGAGVPFITPNRDDLAGDQP